MSGVQREACYFGKEAAAKRDILKVRHPITQGIVDDWDAMAWILEHTFSEVLRLDSSSQAVLLTECPLNPRSNRERAVEIMFESFSTSAVCIQQTAVMSLYASGRRTGLALESGDGLTLAVPVHEGFVVKDGVRRLDVSGSDVTQVLEKQLKAEGVWVESLANVDILQDIKEKLCYVATDYELECQKPIQDIQANYTLPDGNTITVGRARFQAAEAMFDPQKVPGLEAEAGGVCGIASACINASDINMRNALAENIVLVRAVLSRWRTWHNEVRRTRS